MSRGLEMAHRFRDRQPQPMQESSPSRSRSRAAICSSSRDRQCLVIRCQSARVGVRPWGRRSELGADLLQAEADVAGGSDEGEAAQHAPLVPALAAAAAGGLDQPLALVVAQRRAAKPLRSTTWLIASSSWLSIVLAPP